MLCKKKKKRNYRVSWSLFKIKYRRRLTRVDILLFRLCSWSDSPCLIVSHIAFTILLTTMARHIVLRFENWKNVLTRTPRWMVSSSWHQCEPNVSIIPAFRESAFGSHPTSFCQNAVSFTFGTYRREGENQRHHLSRSVFNKSDGDCFSVINLHTPLVHLTINLRMLYKCYSLFTPSVMNLINVYRTIDYFLQLLCDCENSRLFLSENCTWHLFSENMD